MGPWEVKNTNSGTAREEEAREGNARLAQRSTIIAFPTTRSVQVSLLAGAKSVKGKRGRAKWRKGKGRAVSFPLFINPLSFFP